MYWLFLPLPALDPRPSVTVVTMIVLAAILSTQLSLLKTSFSQQAKDSAVIHQQVLHEYNTKFVHPSLTREVREVSTQTPPKNNVRPSTSAGFAESKHDARVTEVDASNPFFLINRGFHTNPNPAYAAQYDPDHQSTANQTYQRLSRPAANPVLRTPATAYASTSTSTAMNGRTSSAELSSPLRPPPTTSYRQPHFRSREGPGPAQADGGSLGVYSHAASPLRKMATSNLHREADGEARARKRETSPVKRTSTPTGLDGQFERLRRDGAGLVTARRQSGRY